MADAPILRKVKGQNEWQIRTQHTSEHLKSSEHLGKWQKSAYLPKPNFRYQIGLRIYFLLGFTNLMNIINSIITLFMIRFGVLFTFRRSNRIVYTI